MRQLAAVALAVGLALPAPAFAQNRGSSRDHASDSPPVSLERIRRGLQEAESRPPVNQLRLSYYVAVIGESKPIDIFKDFDMRHGAVPFTAPSHQELFEQVTPREFRAPPADILGAAVWLGSKLVKKAADNRK